MGIKRPDLALENLKSPGFSGFKQMAPARGSLHAHDPPILRIPHFLHETSRLELHQQPRHGRCTNLLGGGKLLHRMRPP